MALGSPPTALSIASSLCITARVVGRCTGARLVSFHGPQSPARTGPAERAGPNNPINPAAKDDTDNRKRVHNNERQFGHMAATVQLK